MTNQGGPPLQPLNVSTIGPEPTGATPVDDEDLDGLIPTYVSTRADLNQVEYENIARAIPWAQRPFTWGSSEREVDSATRDRYINALKEAPRDECASLIEFARS